MISKALAKLMFEAYAVHAKGVTYDKRAIPTWEQLGTEVQDHWVAAAEAGREALVKSMNLETHELLQFRHAANYVNNYADARVSGSNVFMILAKVAKALSIR